MITLPEEKSTVENYNPQLLVLYGRPKCGKSSFIASLDNNLVIDLENGYRALSVFKVQARTANDLKEIRKAIIAKAREIGKYPYRFITIDNATRLETIALSLAAQIYRNTPMGANWGLKRDKNNMPLRDENGQTIPDPKADVRQLPNGGGYLYNRLAIRQLVDMFKPLCETLILICHVKDKQIRMNGAEMSEMAVDLAGKSADIICGEADAVGYMFREGNKTYISFEGGEGSLKEARPLHLRNKRFCVGEGQDDGTVVFTNKEIFV